MNLNNQYLEKKVQSIFDQALALTTPNKIVEKKDPQQKLNIQNKTEFLRSQFGTERDGSLGAWGGKKYEGLGMRDQFTNYRKQISKNFYSQGNSIR